MPLELMQLRLVSLIDNCLEILEKEPEYVFHLDAQTVVLEDYLLYRPRKREQLIKMITEKRLMVGPWYLQNDFFLTSGEATIRNLRTGGETAKEFGHCDTAGYAPDQFGIISQLPQILSNFGITSFIFGRGLSPDDDPPGEFVWQGPDGSTLTAVHLGTWYNNAQRFSKNTQKAARMVENLDSYFSRAAATPYRLLMNGVDHLEAQEDLLPILQALEEHWNGERTIRQGRLTDYIEMLEAYVRENNLHLPVIKGELRQGPDWSILKGCLSSRTYLKIANVRAQNELEVQLEPLYAMLELGGLGGVYSRDHFTYMWKKLLRNHPHDSICGCSCDEVHRRMEESYASIALTAGECLRQGMEAAANHMSLDVRDPRDYIVTVANPTEALRSGFVEVALDFPACENVHAFVLLDPQGNTVPFALTKHESVQKDMFTPINLPGRMDVDRYHIKFFEREIQPFAFKAYKVCARTGELPAPETAAPQTVENGSVTLENEYLTLTVHADGRADLTDKQTGRTFADILDWEEVGETGDSYMHFPASEPPVYGHDFPARVSVDEKSGECVICRTLSVPCGYDFERKMRKKEPVDCPTEIHLYLEPGSPVLRLDYRLENRAADHRLRLMIRTGILTEESISDTPFDIHRRNKNDHYKNTQNRIFPNTSFAALEQDGSGIAVLTEGQHAYEHLENEGILAFTVVRGTDVISRDFGTGKAAGGKQWTCPENQCLRTLSGSMGIYPYARGYTEAGVMRQAKLFRNPLRGYFTSADPRKFMGGRPAVQDSAVHEIFYRDDPWPDILLPNNESLLKLDGDTLVVSAFKMADAGSGYILRLFNPTENVCAGRVSFASSGTLYMSDMTEALGEKIGDNTAELTVAGKQIVTLRFKAQN